MSGSQSQLQRWHQLWVRLEFMPQQDVGDFAADGDGRQAQMGKNICAATAVAYPSDGSQPGRSVIFGGLRIFWKTASP